jgi:membrane protein DedA with SNARE-associated domain
MSFQTAFIGLTLGIAGGDFGLYLLGRLAREPVMRWRWIGRVRLEAAEGWFARHGLRAVLLSRFLPGTRLATYLAAGALRVSPGAFLLTAIGGSMVWTFLLLTLAVRLGSSALLRASQWKLPIGLGLVALLIAGQWTLGRWNARRIGRPRSPKVNSIFEFWSPYLFYPPVLLYAFWLALRHRSLLLPTLANPSIYSGGMIMESKAEILSLVPPGQRQWVAPWAAFTVPLAKADGLRDALATLEAAGLTFPIVAKPDVGQRGSGVRLVRDGEALAAYLDQCPPGLDLILQRLVPYGHEAGVFYYRMPGITEGHIFSITLKEFPVLVGDGVRTLRELILADPRARHQRAMYFRRHAEVLDARIPAGESFALVFAGNHCQGSIFRNGAAIETPELAARIHGIAASIPGFYFGRFDIRFRSLEALQRGEAFQIVEINGASAEATHIWDPETRLRDAYRTLFQQFSILYQIGARNRALGHRPLPLRRFLRDLWTYQRRVGSHPATS